MRLPIFICLLSLLSHTLGIAQVSADTSFINNGDKFSIKGESAFSWKSFKPSFGPFETLSVSKGKKDREKLGKESSLSGSSGKLGIMKTVDRKISQPVTLTALYNSTDTIFIEMLMVNITRNTSEIIQLGKNKQEGESSDVVHCEEIEIRTTNDSSIWLIPQLPQLIQPFTYERIDTSGKEYPAEEGVLSNNNHHFEIKAGKDFPVKGKIRKADWLWGSSGYLFFSGDKQVAGIQLTPEMNVWLLKDLTARDKQILGSAIISIISARSYKN